MAEIGSEQLRKNLHHEKKGKAQRRGITDSEPDLQTFEIYFAENQYKEYRNYLRDVENRINEAHQKNNMMRTNVDLMLGSLTQTAIPEGFDMSKLERHQIEMNNMMIHYIERVRKEPERFMLNQPGW